MSRTAKIICQDAVGPWYCRVHSLKISSCLLAVLSDLTNAKAQRKIMNLVKPLFVSMWNGMGWQPGEVVIIF